MKIERYVTPLLDSNMYVIAEDDHCIIIDPYFNPAAELLITDLTTDFMLTTHEHYDHISGINALRERYHCPVISGAVCAERLPDPKRNFSHYFRAYVSLQSAEKVPEELLPTEEYITYADESFQGKKDFLWQGHRIELTETPGHSPGSICILLDKKFLFSGDTLLLGGRQMTRFPDGSRSQYEQNARPYLQALPPDVLVYPGHYDAFYLKDCAIN